MERIALIIGRTCVLIFVFGIVYEFLACEKLSKIIKFVISVYIISVILKSVLSFEGDSQKVYIDTDTLQSNYTQTFYSEVIIQTERNLEKTIKNRFNEKNISYNHISVHILEENGSLAADKIVIKCDAVYKAEALGCISDIVDENTEVIIGE